MVNRREFIKIGVAGAVGFGVASAIEIPLLENQMNLQTSQNQTQTSNLQGQINELQGFLTLNSDEKPIVEALAETIIPSDSNGPGAKEAGVIYFIDNMLARQYGQAAGKWWFMQGPFIQPQKTGTSLTVSGAVYPSTTKTAMTYTDGTIKPRPQAGTAYQYSFTPREFWRRGLMQLQSYCQAAKGGNFQNLSYEERIVTLQELYDNSPTNTALQSAFVSPTSSDFYNEVYDLVVAGFWADPLYGGNNGKVGWSLIASNGVNSGSGQGHSPLELALSTTTVKLPPLSLGDLQRGATM